MVRAESSDFSRSAGLFSVESARASLFGEGRYLLHHSPQLEVLRRIDRRDPLFPQLGERRRVLDDFLRSRILRDLSTPKFCTGSSS